MDAPGRRHNTIARMTARLSDGRTAIRHATRVHLAMAEPDFSEDKVSSAFLPVAEIGRRANRGKVIDRLPKA
jgi:hypothetical protein